MACVYVQRNLEWRLSQSTGAANWLGDEYGDLTQQLNDSESALIDFKRKNNVVAVAIEDQQSDLATRHKKLADELSSVQVRLIALKAQRENYSKIGSDDPLNDAGFFAGVTDSPVAMKLKELYCRAGGPRSVEMRGKYLDKHPAVIAQENRVEAVRGDLKREGLLAQKNVEAQYGTLVKQEKDLRIALDAVTHEALQLEQRAIDYNRLKRNFDRLSKLSDQVGGRERETSLAGHLKTNNVSVLDPATVPVAAIAPDVPRAVGSAFAVGLLLAVGLALFLELLDTTVKTQDDVEKAVGLSFLGLIPTIQSDVPGSKGSNAAIPPPKALEDAIRKGAGKAIYTSSRIPSRRWPSAAVRSAPTSSSARPTIRRGPSSSLRPVRRKARPPRRSAWRRPCSAVGVARAAGGHRHAAAAPAQDLRHSVDRRRRLEGDRHRDRCVVHGRRVGRAELCGCSPCGVTPPNPGRAAACWSVSAASSPSSRSASTASSSTRRRSARSPTPPSWPASSTA